ncbi:MAG: magnesium/cobalt transporter CorA [Armatimonadota bacterium]
MHPRLKSVADSSGLAPAAVVHVGDTPTGAGSVTVHTYGPDRYECRCDPDFSAEMVADSETVTWVSVTGVDDVQKVTAIGEHYGLHPLVIEDVANTRQRPKVEEYDDYLFVVLKSLGWIKSEQNIQVQQVSIVLTGDTVITFAEYPPSVFEDVVERIDNGRGKIRTMGADYLAYAILDAVVDGYFVILQQLGERIEDVEYDLVEDPDSEMLADIHDLKQQMLVLRKLLWPLREAISVLERRGSPLIHDETATYMRDVYDHVFQVIEATETYREMLSSMLEMYMSSVSNRMNTVMSVLTIIATIFIPLTFIAGIYGMNFEYMPELKWRYGYPVVLAIMGIIGLVMIIMFRRRKWL